MPKAILHEATYKSQTHYMSVNKWVELIGRTESFIRCRLRVGKSMQDVADDATILDKTDGLGIREEAVRKFLYG